MAKDLRSSDSSAISSLKTQVYGLADLSSEGDGHKKTPKKTWFI